VYNLTSAVLGAVETVGSGGGERTIIKLINFPDSPRVADVEVGSRGIEATLHSVVRPRQFDRPSGGEHPLTWAVGSQVTIEYRERKDLSSSSSIGSTTASGGAAAAAATKTEFGRLLDLQHSAFTLQNGSVDGVRTFLNVDIVSVQPMRTPQSSSATQFAEHYGQINVALSRIRTAAVAAIANKQAPPAVTATSTALVLRTRDDSISWSVFYDVVIRSSNVFELTSRLVAYNAYPYDIDLETFSLVEDRPRAGGVVLVARKKTSESQYRSSSAAMAPRGAMASSQRNDFAGETEESATGVVQSLQTASLDDASTTARGGVAVREFRLPVKLAGMNSTAVALFQSQTDKARLYACATLTDVIGSGNEHVQQAWRNIDFETVLTWKRADLANGAFLFSGAAEFCVAHTSAGGSGGDDARTSLGEATLSGWLQHDFQRISFGDTGAVYGRARVRPGSHNRDITTTMRGEYVLELELNNTLSFGVGAKLLIRMPKNGSVTPLLPLSAVDSLDATMVPEWPGQMRLVDTATLGLQLAASAAAGKPVKRELQFRVQYSTA
jgi:hypothetical protein